LVPASTAPWQGAPASVDVVQRSSVMPRPSSAIAAAALSETAVTSPDVAQRASSFSASAPSQSALAYAAPATRSAAAAIPRVSSVAATSSEFAIALMQSMPSASMSAARCSFSRSSNGSCDGTDLPGGWNPGNAVGAWAATRRSLILEAEAISATRRSFVQAAISSTNGATADASEDSFDESDVDDVDNAYAYPQRATVTLGGGAHAPVDFSSDSGCEGGGVGNGSQEETPSTASQSAAGPPQQFVAAAYTNGSRAGISKEFSTRQVASRKTVAAQALGVQRHAGRKTVKQAFKDSALMLHPDKGGDKEDFQVINEAYRLLASGS